MRLLHVFFFFSSRRRHTRFKCDWSSDVCSSDLHADYSLSGMRIMVAVFDDRMEIQNPGMLPFGMTLDDMMAGVSKVRNRVIVRALGVLGLVEEWGSGYK